MLAGLVWGNVKLDPGGTQIGRFSDTNGTPYYMAGVESSGAPAWTISTTAPSSGVVEVLFKAADATILQGGTVTTDGGLSYGGSTYHVQFYWDGAEMVARTHLT